MYCSVCGQQVEGNQQSCPKCGRAVTGGLPATPTPAYASPAMATIYPSRVARHIHTLGVLWLVYAGWLLLTWAIAATFLTGMFGMHRFGGPFAHMDPWGSTFPFGGMQWLIPFITFILVIRAALSVLTGIALLRRERWGRTLALVLAFLTLIKPLTGTLLAIYTLWVLLPSDSGMEYEQLSQ